MEDLVMVGEAARILRRGAETVLRWEKAGLLPTAARQPLTGNRVWPRAVVEELAERLKIKEPVSS